MNPIRVASGSLGSVSSELLQRLARRGLECVDRPARRFTPILVFCEESGVDLVERISQLNPSGLERVVVLADLDSLPNELPWRLISGGASEILELQSCDETASKIAARTQRWSEVDGLVESAGRQANLVGQSSAFIKALRNVVEIAAFTSSGVLLTGESGTGKEQMARLVHALDRRAGKRDFVTLDCTTVVPELSGSEFFGHERGAYTGAVNQRDGAFALADKGTLFLDEVGELGMSLQAQLLRAVQERTYKRVGGNHWYEADFRLVTATNRNLSVEVEQRSFRGDFYHRIATWMVELPPLRVRRDDIPLLAERFARDYFGSDHSEIVFDDRARQFLYERSYPGNVRELRQVVTRLCGRHVGTGAITIGDIAPSDLPPPDAPPEPGLEGAVRRAVLSGTGLKEIGRVAREVAIGKALEASQHNVQQAARLLKITDRALQMELAKREA